MAVIKKPIYRDKVWVDPNIVSNKYTHGDNSVEYAYYRDHDKSTVNKPYIPNNPREEFGCTVHTDICFSGLSRTIGDSRNHEDGAYNRVYYKMRIDKKAKVKNTLAEQKRFIELSVANKLLPKYVTPDTMKNDEEGTIVLMLEGLTVSQFYIYLTQYRYMREYPGFVKSMVHLVDDKGFNFFAAFILASIIVVDYTVHHFLTLQRKYGSNEDINTVKAPFSYIAGLRRYVKRNHMHDDRILMKSSHAFTVASNIESVCKINKTFTAQELKDPMVIKAFSAMTDEVAIKYINKYNDNKCRIIYREMEKGA